MIDDIANKSVEHAAAQLSEHFDSVVIITTKGDKLGYIYQGNWYAMCASVDEVYRHTQVRLDPAEEGDDWKKGQTA